MTLEKYDCATCEANGTVKDVGFYEIGTEIICEFCYLEARKMDEND